MEDTGLLKNTTNLNQLIYFKDVLTLCSEWDSGIMLCFKRGYMLQTIYFPAKAYLFKYVKMCYICLVTERCMGVLPGLPTPNIWFIKKKKAERPLVREEL